MRICIDAKCCYWIGRIAQNWIIRTCSTILWDIRINKKIWIYAISISIHRCSYNNSSWAIEKKTCIGMNFVHFVDGIEMFGVQIIFSFFGCMKKYKCVKWPLTIMPIHFPRPIVYDGCERKSHDVREAISYDLIICARKKDDIHCIICLSCTIYMAVIFQTAGKACLMFISQFRWKLLQPSGCARFSFSFCRLFVSRSLFRCLHCSLKRPQMKTNNNNSHTHSLWAQRNDDVSAWVVWRSFVCVRIYRGKNETAKASDRTKSHAHDRNDELNMCLRTKQNRIVSGSSIPYLLLPLPIEICDDNRFW